MKKIKILLVTTILVSVLTLLISPLQAVAQKTDPESVIRGIWEDALNAKDLDKALTLVTDDARLVLIPAPRGTNGVFNGKTELRGWWEEFAVTRNGYVEFTDFHVFGNNVVCTMKVSDDGLRAMGVAPVYMNGVGIVQNDLLKSSEWTFTEESLARFNAAMMHTTNKAIARRYLEDIWNNGDMAVADEILAEDFVNHNPFGPLPPDREGLKIAASGMAAAPGNFTMDDIIAEGDKVAIHTPYHGNPEFDGIVILRIKDGKITDRWGYTDHGQQLAQSNKDIARRFLEEIWNKGDIAAANELIAEDFINHAPGRGVPPDREGLKQEVNGLLAAFSAPFTIDDLIAEGDKVVIRGTFRSVHNGEFLGVPATGKEVTHTWTAILRIENGKVVERWADVDRLKFMTDLGILPAPGQGGK